MLDNPHVKIRVRRLYKILKNINGHSIFGSVFTKIFDMVILKFSSDKFFLITVVGKATCIQLKPSGPEVLSVDVIPKGML